MHMLGTKLHLKHAHVRVPHAMSAGSICTPHSHPAYNVTMSVTQTSCRLRKIRSWCPQHLLKNTKLAKLNDMPQATQQLM